jgi:hypothetical protein
MKRYAIVFVHLGDNPSPTLIPFAKYAAANNPESQLILITDDVSRWRDFPGQVIESRKRKKSAIKHLIKGSRYADKIAGGYWVRTYERLFALEALCENIEPTQEIIHLESDVLLQDVKIIERALAIDIVHEIAVPRMSKDLGIASILYAKNTSSLRIGLDKLRVLGEQFPSICTNDMKLLGLALNTDQISELPTWTTSVEKQKEYFLFDGAAIGQYLFGRDPIHTNNARISGYENPEFPIKPSNLKWAIDQNSILAETENEKYYFANLHVHSKELIALPMDDAKRWDAVLSEANGLSTRIPSSKVEEEIHHRGYSILVKLEIYFRDALKSKIRGKS